VLKIIRLVRDRTPGIGDKTDRLVTNLLPANLADGDEAAQVTGRADKAWAVAHADLGLHVARLMRVAVGGG
jgi:hypothetical protein